MSTANLNDMATLATDGVFGNRVFMALCIYCSSTILNETITSATVQIHAARKNFASQVLNNPNQYKPLFVNIAACNQTVANDATGTTGANGTLVGLTSTALATAALACTDTDIENAVAASFNSFIPGLG